MSRLLAFLFAAMVVGVVLAAGIRQRPEVGAFIRELSQRHHFDEHHLERLFDGVEIQEKILAAMARPAEVKPWYVYRRIFLTEERIQGGVDFWRQNASSLARAEARHGVAPEMIVAILGLETNYGRNTGNYRVIDALATLAFAYPRRAEFFRSELEQFLLLCREEGIDPTSPKGSYAGAMGLPQFMPSSFRSYAEDLDGDGRRDIWSNPWDAIGSIGNYFAHHGWRAGEPVAVPAKVRGNEYGRFLGRDLRPLQLLSDLREVGVEPERSLPGSARVRLLRFELENGSEYWLGFENFYVISRYNHSPLYAMAAYQLGRAIADRKGS